MKIVLLKDVAGVGQKNDVQSVSDGYALNFLIPKKLSVAGTPKAIAHAKRLESEHKAERRIQVDLLMKNLASVAGVVIELGGKASEKGHLFASIHAKDIVAALKKQKGIDLSPEFLELPHPIKSVGEHQVQFKTDGQTGHFTLVVTSSLS